MSNCCFTGKNLSHEKLTPSYQSAKQALIDKIQQRGDLPHVSVKEQLDLLEQISEFKLGQFLIERGGLNGYWSHHMLTHPQRGRFSSIDSRENPLHPLEAFVLNSAPTCLASQERFQICKTLTQRHVIEGCSFASIPCGVMADLLDLDYSGIKHFSIHGIDIDVDSLSLAKNYAEKKGLSSHCCFSQQDAWSIQQKKEFDLITSSGLTIYEPDDERVTALYQRMHEALKQNGVLITSFLTPPLSWKIDRVNPQHALLQKIILIDILGVKWHFLRQEELVKNQLRNAGFHKIELFYDQAHISPTVIATKH